jgi:leader peptidase (prepilin peptidase)/N-methyltransferase
LSTAPVTSGDRLADDRFPPTPVVATAAVTGALLVALAVRWGWVTPAFAVFGAVLGAVAVHDSCRRKIPNSILYPGAVAAGSLLLLAWSVDGGPIGRALGAAVVVFLLFLAVASVSPGGLGMGDVKLVALVGLFLGWIGWGQLWWAIVAALVVSAVVGVGMRLRGGPRVVPLAPFLALACIAVLMADCGVGGCR